MPDDEQPAFELLNPKTGTGLRIWANGTVTGRQPVEGEPYLLINRIPGIRTEAFARGLNTPPSKSWPIE